MDAIKIKPSKNFIIVLKELKDCPDIHNNLKESLKNFDEKSEELFLTEIDVKWCHSKIKERGIPHRIHSLLNESEIVLPSHIPPKRNPELEARIQKLRLEQEEREYQNMTRNVNFNSYAKKSEIATTRDEFKEINKQLITGAQYLMSVIGTFFAVFMGTSLLTQDYGPRSLLAVFSAATVGIAEIYFIIRDDIRAEEKLKQN